MCVMSLKSVSFDLVCMILFILAPSPDPSRKFSVLSVSVSFFVFVCCSFFLSFFLSSLLSLL